MPRILILSIMLMSFIISGCSKKQDEADKLQQEAAEDEAAAVMDSLSHPQQLPDTTITAPEKQVSQTPTTPEAEQPDSEYQIETGFVVQVGSYSDRELADYWAERYRNWGYDAFVQTANILGETYYRLRIGAFETYGEAMEIGKMVADRYSADFWVDNSR